MLTITDLIAVKDLPQFFSLPKNVSDFTALFDELGASNGFFNFFRLNPNRKDKFVQESLDDIYEKFLKSWDQHRLPNGLALPRTEIIKVLDKIREAYDTLCSPFLRVEYRKRQENWAPAETEVSTTLKNPEHIKLMRLILRWINHPNTHQMPKEWLPLVDQLNQLEINTLPTGSPWSIHHFSKMIECIKPHFFGSNPKQWQELLLEAYCLLSYPRDYDRLVHLLIGPKITLAADAEKVPGYFYYAEGSGEIKFYCVGPAGQKQEMTLQELIEAPPKNYVKVSVSPLELFNAQQNQDDILLHAIRQNHLYPTLFTKILQDRAFFRLFDCAKYIHPMLEKPNLLTPWVCMQLSLHPTFTRAKRETDINQKTPYQRLLAYPAIDPEILASFQPKPEELLAEFLNIQDPDLKNVFTLRDKLQKLLLVNRSYQAFNLLVDITPFGLRLEFFSHYKSLSELTDLKEIDNLLIANAANPTMLSFNRALYSESLSIIKRTVQDQTERLLQPMLQDLQKTISFMEDTNEMKLHLFAYILAVGEQQATLPKLPIANQQKMQTMAMNSYEKLTEFLEIYGVTSEKDYSRVQRIHLMTSVQPFATQFQEYLTQYTPVLNAAKEVHNNFIAATAVIVELSQAINKKNSLDATSTTSPGRMLAQNWQTQGVIGNPTLSRQREDELLPDAKRRCN